MSDRVVAIEWKMPVRLITFSDGSSEWEFDLPEMALNAPAAKKLVAAFEASVRERVAE